MGKHPAGMPTNPISRPGHRALRKGRCSIPDQIYLLTAVTLGRECLFADWQTAMIALRLIADPALWRGSKLLCWVLMPDHGHAVVELGDGESLGKRVKRVKSVLARAINRQRGSRGIVRAAAFHDHALRHENDLLATARHVIANPIGAGLVTRIGNYPDWNAIWLPP